MLADLLPQKQQAHRSLPVLGSALDAFDDWMIQQGYRFNTRQCYVLRCTAIDHYLRQRRYRLEGLTSAQLRQCHRYFRHRSGGISGTVGCLERFLRSQARISLAISSARPFDETLSSYRRYMLEVRGLAATSVDRHSETIIDFLHYLYRRGRTFRLADLSPDHVDRFVRSVASRFNRQSLQHVVSHIRAFIRFLRLNGHMPEGPEFVIYKPRLYRGEQLPRALPWETVRAFLKSIDRNTGAGLRDYAMFLLIATYGLRGCDIAGLQLDDIDWRAGVFHIRQRKTRSALDLPLTRAVAAALLAYLRKGRPRTTDRAVFFSAVAPVIPLKRQMVGYAFRYRVRTGTLKIPFKGVHCLRHSYALRLLRSGISLKTIGDLLGHTTIESTGVYLRVNIDDLREVALPLPATVTGRMPA